MSRERILKRLSFISGLGILTILVFGSVLNGSQRGAPTFGDTVEEWKKNEPVPVHAAKTAPPLTTQQLTDPPGPYPTIPDSDRTLVLLLSYQRSGSSFIGDALFNINPDSFFIYEPLDQVYAAMYGAAQGWTVPADITTHPDGTLRIPPQEELDGVTWMMEVLLTCNVTSLPLEIFIHGFWRQQSYHMNSLVPFMRCMKGQDALAKLDVCHAHLKKVCGRKFGERGKKQDVCLRHLWQHEDDKTTKLKPKEKQSFAAYDKCIEHYRTKVNRCIPRFQRACSTHSLHAMKTVRATMRSVEPLLEKYPNFKVMHLFRDPRAVVGSRKRASWARGRYDRLGDVTNIARVYCQTVLEDYRQRKRLEHKYPGRIMQLEYGDFFNDPVTKLDEVYQFLHLPIVSEKFQATFYNRTHGKNSQQIATKWQRELTPQQVAAIEKECETFAHETGFKWH